MRLELRDGLIFTSLSITYKGKIKRIENIILDTGAAQSIVSPDAVEELGITVEGMKEPYVKGLAAPSRPRVMRGQPRGSTRSVDRGKRRPAIELRNHPSGVPTMWTEGEGNTVYCAGQRVVYRPRGVKDPEHAWTLYAREPGDLSGTRRLK